MHPPSENPRPVRSLWWLFWAAVALITFTAALYFAGRERQYVGETVHLRRELQMDAEELGEWRQAAEVLARKDVVRFASTPLAPDGAPVIVYVGRRSGVILIAEHLSPAPPGKKYEMWIVQPGRPATAAGLFQARSGGPTLHTALSSDVAQAPGAEVIVTLENEGGASQPSEPALLSIPISGSPLR